MENENIRENENLNPEETENETEVISEESPAEAVEKTESIAEEIAEETIEEIPLDDEEVLSEEDIIREEWQTEDAPIEVELSEEELAAIREAKKKRTAKILIISGIVALFVALCAAFYCYSEGVGSKTAVDTPMQVSEYYLTGKGDNIKFQSPVTSILKTMIGKEKDAVMTIGGKAVDKDIFSYITNMNGLNSVSSLIQTGMLTAIEDFTWDMPEYTTGLSYLEYAKGLGLNSLIPIYSLVADGEKHGIVLTEEEEQKIRDDIEALKTQLGENFELALQRNGFDSEETMFEVQKIDALAEKTVKDVEADISKYASTEDIIKNEAEEKVTVKHILIAFDNEMTGDVTEEKRNLAKKAAEEVLAKVKSGEDFDKLIEEYNQDPGATDEGYTFAADGSMVKAFEDASFALKVGETSELVETSYGYHIIKRIERAVSMQDYMNYIMSTSKVKINKGKYNDTGITINLEDYFGAPAE